MSGTVAVESARRRFTGKRADTVLKLSRAAVEVLHDVGYGELTLPAVAGRAGVARATAYTYFSSKEHLVAEVYWRRLSSSEPAGMDSPVAVERVVAVLRHLALIFGDEPALAYAVTVTMNSADSDVVLLRVQIGKLVHDLIAGAVGDAADREAILMLELIYIGAMVRAGAGGASYDEVADQLESAARRILG